MMWMLARASMDGAILVAAVWVLSRVLRLTPATRTILWWCAAAKFVVALGWTTPIAIPVLPAETTIVHRTDHVAAPRGEVLSSRPRAAAAARPDLGNPFVRAFREWSSFAAIAWGLGLFFVAIVGVRRWRGTVHMLNASEPAPDEIQAQAAHLASRLRLRRVPEVRISARIETPLVTGLVRPVVLLPSGRLDALTDRQRQMALCHELAHLKRADLWLGCVPALAERVFFFHPLVHLASREYALSREAACDASVMETLDAAPQEYGRLLLSLGVSHPRTGFAAAGGAWSFLSLKRRIAMLQEVSARSNRSRAIAFGAVGLAVAAMVPMQLAARSGAAQSASTANSAAQEASRDEQRRREPAASEAAAQVESRPNTRGLAFVMTLENGQQTSSGSSEDVARARRHQRNGEPILWFRYDGREYVVRDPEVLGQARALWSDVYASGAGGDAMSALSQTLTAELAKHKELAEQEEFFKHDALSRHKELLEQGESFKREALSKHEEMLKIEEFIKTHELAKHAEQDELEKHVGLKDEEILSARLGSMVEQGLLGAHLGSMALEQALRALTDARAGSEIEIDRAELEHHRRAMNEAGKEIEEQMRGLEQRLKGDLDSQMRELHHQLRTIEEPMREMAAPMKEFGHRMEAFGQTIERATRKANEEMRALVERALASGLAQPVR
jgi:bla regulator protein blaR1